MTKAQKQYCKAVSAAVVCDSRQKRAFMKTLRADVGEYLTLQPDATGEQLAARFGTPQEIAAGFLTADPARAAKRLRLRKIVLFAVLAALLLYLVFLIASLIDVHEEAHGVFEEGLLAVQTWIGGGIL